MFESKIVPWQSATNRNHPCRDGRHFGPHTVRVISPDEIERMLAEHRLYLETEYHQSRRAHLSSTDLTARIFAGSIIVGALLCWGGNAAKE